MWSVVSEKATCSVGPSSRQTANVRSPVRPTALDNVLDSNPFPAGYQWIRLNVNFALAGSEW